jgi:stress-induced morphogen
MQECIDKLPTNKAYSIVLDNASWHTSEAVRNTDVHRFFCFNVPGVFQLNMIENSFSGVRNDFRHRTVCDSLAKEIEQISKLFLPNVNRQRFVGYYKNYLRSLNKYLITDEF